MKRLLSITMLLCAVLVGSAYAEQPRNCIGPVTLNAPSLYAPDTTGFNVRHIDGDMTVHIWKANNDAIAVKIQSSNFTAAEDPLGNSFVDNDTLTTTDQRTLKGPLERIRFLMTTCDDNTPPHTCLAYAKICGRVSQ